MPKKITIDTLAKMTQDEFERMGERFDAVDARFDKVDARLDKMDENLVQMNSTLKTVLDVVLDIPSKKAFNRLETKADAMEFRLTAVERKVK